ncbi:hypothetical protein WJX81_003652 [Elliptochloris bilobata]|uniref:ATPase AAA-type core domain-containing protein n=1 Tax=Elliptochloris bilobata TaxID=381761 RepID=A0AAW1RKI0_9CHLO
MTLRSRMRQAHSKAGGASSGAGLGRGRDSGVGAASRVPLPHEGQASLQDEEAEDMAQEPLGLPWRWVLLAVVLAGVASLATSQWHHQPAFRAAWAARSHALQERMGGLSSRLAQQRDWSAAQARALAAGADATVRRGAGDAAAALQRSASWAGETAHAARQRAGAAAAHAGRTASEAWQRTFRVRLVRRGSRGHGVGRPCAAALDADALDAILRNASQWDGTRALMRDVWRGHKEDPRKGAGVLLAGGSAAALQAATLAIKQALPPICSGCLLVLQAERGDLSNGGAENRGLLQSRLAAFLKACPASVIVLESVQALHPELLPVLVNALGEGGAFEADGSPVPAWKATYVVSMLVPGALFDAEGDTAFGAAVKKELTSALKGKAEGSALALADAARDAEAFRRRLEYVAPLRG